MTKKKLKKILRESVLILDGATGTELQNKGLPQGECPEKWVLEHPEALIEVQRQYIQAGSKAVYAFTFGANPIKLKSYGLEDKVVEMNRKLVEISKEAVGEAGYVAGDLSPTGEYIEPMGKVTFEKAVECYKKQVEGLLLGGVDFFVIETMMDIQEARAALLAVKESCDLPVFVSMTFQENRRTLTGTDPVTALITLQNLGADVVGCNCSTGPETMVKIITEMKPYAAIPLMAKPNAGLPKYVDGKTCFDMGKDEFASYGIQLIQAGANVIGGCCGTDPSYIRELNQTIGHASPIPWEAEKRSMVSSGREVVNIGVETPITIIGERINPTGKKKLQALLRKGEIDTLQDIAAEQVEQGAKILDVNVGMSGIDEKELMAKTVQLLAGTVRVPLCIDSSDPKVVEAALRIYPGRAIVNSVSLEEVKIRELLPIAAKYGAMIIVLPVSDEGIPKTLEDRKLIIQKIMDKAAQYGYTEKDVIVDGLVMAVSSNPRYAGLTLDTISWCTETLRTNTVVGLSNISFGLPQRQWMNGTFLAMAAGRGLNMAIANPSNDVVMNIRQASDVLAQRDEGCKNYLGTFGGTKKNLSPTREKVELEETAGGQEISAAIHQTVLNGEKNKIVPILKKAVGQGMDPKKIMNEVMIPSITEVGELYEKEIYFLPQLILSGETMRQGCNWLETLFKKEEQTSLGKVITATVKGDIHDIGKNIVVLMLRNHGFTVVDLGKDVAAETIIQKAKEENADIIGLSALMTTTMVQMKEVIKQAAEENLPSRIIVGGAVVTQEYADEIGAHGYSKDANGAVQLVKKLLNLG